MTVRFFIPLLVAAVLPLFAQGQAPEAEAATGKDRSCFIPDDARGVQVPLKSTFWGLTVPVRINGQLLELIIDTGATYTTLPPSTADKLGLDREEAPSQALAIDGQGVKLQVARTRTIEIGGAKTENELICVCEFPEGLSNTIHGVLGLRTISDWDVRIDPAELRLTLFPPMKAPALENETTLPLAEIPGPAFTVPVGVGSHRLQALLDTGSGSTLRLPNGLAREIAPEALEQTLPSIRSGVGVSGVVEAWEAKLAEFHFGPDTLRGLPVSFAEIAPGSKMDKMPVLGFGVLEHYVMTLSIPHRQLRIKPLGTVTDLVSSSTAGINLIPAPGGRLVISDVTPDGPADRAGLQSGDEFLAIEGHAMKSMTPQQFAAFKRLPPGTPVRIRYRRPGEDEKEATLQLEKE